MRVFGLLPFRGLGRPKSRLSGEVAPVDEHAPLARPVECHHDADQRALPGSGDPRHHREGADGERHVQVLEVVLAGATDDDGFAGDLFLLQAVIL